MDCDRGNPDLFFELGGGYPAGFRRSEPADRFRGRWMLGVRMGVGCVRFNPTETYAGFSFDFDFAYLDTDHEIGDSTRQAGFYEYLFSGRFHWRVIKNHLVSFGPLLGWHNFAFSGMNGSAPGLTLGCRLGWLAPLATFPAKTLLYLRPEATFTWRNENVFEGSNLGSYLGLAAMLNLGLEL